MREYAMHLSDADLGTILDPSGGGAAGDAARRHASVCIVCAGAVRDTQGADRDVAEAFGLLDHGRGVPRPYGSVRVQGQPGASGASRRRPTAVNITVRRSAIILALSAAVAAAAPHSPLRQFIAHITRSPRATSPSSPLPVVPPPVPERPTASAPVGPRGVAIVAEERVELVFRGAEVGGVMHIRPVVSPRVAVTASADGPRYTVGRGTIVIDRPPGSAVTYDIELPPPAQLADVTIRIGTRVVYARHGTTVVSRGSMQPDGSYEVPFAQ
jgi:hypothetical protein